MKKSVKKDKYDIAAGLMIPGGVLTGLGIAMLKNPVYVGAGALIGLGAGFVLAAIINLFKKN